MTAVTRYFGRTLLLASLMAGTAAAAQTAPAPSPAPTPAPAAAQAPSSVADSADGLGEILVTARRRTETLQEVPLSITALTGATLDAAGVRDIRDISYLTAGMSINSAGAEANVQPVIRGIANLNFGGDPNVAVFVDGIYMSNVSAISLGVVDLERVEVIKGPVSALYGRNSFGGVINYVLKKPSLTTIGGRGSVTYGNDGQRRLVGAIDGPIVSDVLSFGLAGGYEKYKGADRDAVNGLRVGGYEKKDVQASFQLKPDSKTLISGALYYGDDTFDNSPVVYAENNCGSTIPSGITAGQFTQYCGEIKFNPVEVTVINPAAGQRANDRRVWSGNLRIERDLGFATISLLNGYVDVKQSRFVDFGGRRDGFQYKLVPGPGTVGLPTLFGFDSTNTDYSSELRIASPGTGPFRWAFGGYFYDSTRDTATLVGLDGTKIPAGQTIGTNAFVTPTGVPNPPTYSLGKDRQYSGFASTDLDLFQNLTLSGEFRYTQQDRGLDVNAFRSGAYTTLLSKTAGFNFVDYRLTGKYRFRPGLIAYASVGTGHKGGGFNGSATTDAEFTYNPEKGIAYEAGIKSSFLDNTLQVNAAAYYIKVTDIQITGPSDVAGNTGLIVRNFGEVISKGFELETALAPARGIRFHLNLAYTDPKFGKGSFDYTNGAACLAIASCAARAIIVDSAQGPRRVIDLNGLQVPKTSKFQVTTGLELNGNVTSRIGWFGRADYRLETRAFSAGNNFNYWGDRQVVNLRLGVDLDRTKLTAFVDNLLDDRTVESSANSVRLNDFYSNQTGTLAIARRYGLTLETSF